MQVKGAGGAKAQPVQKAAQKRVMSQTDATMLGRYGAPAKPPKPPAKRPMSQTDATMLARYDAGPAASTQRPMSQTDMAMLDRYGVDRDTGENTAALRTWDMGLTPAAPAAPPPPPPPTFRTTGSGRTSSDQTGGAGFVEAAVAPAAYSPPASVTAAPAVVQAPAVIANALASENNVAGEEFSTVGNPSTFGGYERRRQARGPKTGMSVTPEMIRRAAASRLG